MLSIPDKITDLLSSRKSAFMALFLTLLLSINLMAQRSDLYKEQVNVHLGRSTYIAGEVITLKAYCFSNLDDPSKFLSKALYIELIDLNQRSILSQALKIEGNSAATLMEIPDTLVSGAYTLKAYTNWMKNFGETGFYSQPVYIYNQYDEDAEEKLAVAQRVISPQVYIQGGKLIREVPVKLKLYFPGHTDKHLSGVLTELLSGKILQHFTSNDQGEAVLSFTPEANTQYAFSVGDSLSGFKSFSLPEPKFSGYGIGLDSVSADELFISLYASNQPKEQLSLKASSGKKVWAEVLVGEMKDYKSLKLKMPQGYRGIVDIQLWGGRGELLCTQTLQCRKDRQEVGPALFPTRSKVNLEFDRLSIPAPENTDFSVSIHKYKNLNLGSCTGSYALLSLNQEDIGILLPRYQESIQNTRAERQAYLVEDLGINFTGTLENPVNNSPLRNVEVVLAIKDTIGLVLAGNTNDSGHFSILVNEQGNREAYISIYMNKIQVSGNHRIYLDKKFYYEELNSEPDAFFEYQADSGFVEHIKDEAQRVLIQKAFGNIWEPEDSIKDKDAILRKRFYGEPVLTVYPDDFFFLPNFEEIAREILPRVRYKHTGKECELIVTDVENYTRSSNPIVLIDGNLITNHCELYDLDSDDIHRIEVQSGLRASGNLLYDGLVAIYTTPKYKQENGKRNGRNTYPVLGYTNNPKQLSLQDTDLDTDLSGSPDFKNQLYWDPEVPVDDSGNFRMEFYTSDEEGTYVVDIVGYTSIGIPIHLQKIIQVYAD